jgi:hypothetical protein
MLRSTSVGSVEGISKVGPARFASVLNSGFGGTSVGRLLRPTSVGSVGGIYKVG